MTLKSVQFTYRDYLCLDDDKRHEVLEGDLMMVPAPSWRHQDVLTKLFRALDRFVETQALGVVRFAPIDVMLSEENVVQPDLFFIAKDRTSIIQDRGVFGPPDLVIEIISPAKPDRDQIAKRRIYGKYGIKEYWIVDPDKRTVEVLTLTDSGLETYRVFPSPSKIISPIWPSLSLDTQDVL